MGINNNRKKDLKKPKKRGQIKTKVKNRLLLIVSLSLQKNVQIMLVLHLSCSKTYASLFSAFLPYA
jgi:hypothetical protein